MRDKALEQVLREARVTRRKPKRPHSYWLRHQREKCECGGYHFPHRRGGGACIHSERADYYHALRHGVPLAEAMQLLTAGQLEAMFPVAVGDTLVD